MSRQRFHRLAVLLLLAGPVACGSDPAPEPDLAGDPPEAGTPPETENPLETGYRASGNEPFWLMMVEGDAMALTRLGVPDTLRAERPAPEPIDGGWRYASAANGEPYVVRVERRRCNDSMSGRPFPHTVEVSVGDETLTGCGGDTAGLLTGDEWIVTALGGRAPVDTPPTLQFGTDGAVTGTGSCNRYRATYEITGEGVVIGPAAATRMACLEEGVGEQEMRFFAALEQVTRFDIAEDGSLELLAGDEPVIVARR